MRNFDQKPDLHPAGTSVLDDADLGDLPFRFRPIARTLCIASVILLSGWLFPISSAGQDLPSSPPTRGLLSLLWMKNSPQPGPDLFRALDALGVSGTNVAGTAPAKAQLAAHRPFYLEHTAGKGILYLADECWERVQREFLKDTALAGRPRPRCLAQESVRAQLSRRIEQVLDSKARRQAWAFSLDDEVSLGRRRTPIDFCFSPEHLRLFRAWLRLRYGSLKALRQMWDVDVDRFEDVVPLSTQAIRRRELTKSPDRWNLAPWSDFREFMEERFARTLDDLAREVRRKVPGKPVGFSGGGTPSPFSGIDWGRVTRTLDFFEPYDQGGVGELVRTLAPPRAVLFHTLMPHPGGPAFERRELWERFIRGDKGVVLWNSSLWFQEGDVRRPTQRARLLAPTLRLLGSKDAAAWYAARPIAPQVAILESQPSNRLHWMLDTRFDGRAWIHWKDQEALMQSSQNRAREAWIKLLEDLQIPFCFVRPEDVLRGLPKAIRVLILPRTIAMSDPLANAIRTYCLENTVLADMQTGLFDEHLRSRSRGVLDDMFGLERKLRRCTLQGSTWKGPADPRFPALCLGEPGLEASDTATSMRSLAGHPALFVCPQARGGRAVYLNLWVGRYLAERCHGPRHVLRDELRGLLRLSDVRPPVTAEMDGSPWLPLLVRVRTTRDTLLVGIVPNWDATTLASNERLDITALRDALPRAARVRLPRAGRMRPLFLVPTNPKDRPPFRSKFPVSLTPTIGEIVRIDITDEDVRTK
ncbi:MAG TPA: hypothetical protein ENK43_10990 [Planctomycetes bacterium]|nr:hypothetical protein [Planctomycetota bacterium]